MARNADEVIEILTLIERYRGALEGGVCLREFEPLKPETEERYFVLDGRAFGRNDEVPALRRVPCPFLSVDLVASETGALRLVELGDGQVSDRKQWPADRFVAMLQSARG
ncbi:ATP-grasp domain-containing protein [Pseudomonas otitidis]|uniref:ATP-grasp domain-containing protein n=1 Tax=Metapseudomonas otitidis TaxID=319939 RepID=A0ABU3XL39_9GAMM|nr:ATP-grasp domain-containing protein [Pseudomonas otitidis]MDV3438612.1 ATP-grasp domain-containing protein [Pseudomonas otitidis]